MTPLSSPYTGLSRLTLFWALSRTPHGLLDMSTPALGALLWLGRFPSFEVIVLGLITTFAGYTAVYALNDVIDYRVDKEKIRLCGAPGTGCDLDAVMLRHPMAQGYLSFKEGLLWTVAWSVVALMGAYRLNPVCIVIFLAACILETIYCLLLKVTHLRTLVSGGVKTAGAIAGVFAVDPKPSPLYVMVLFFWLFCWEIGGQNVPNDWTDIDEDRRLCARTIPVRLGAESANAIILASLILAVVLSVAVFYFSPITFGFPFVVASFATGLCLFVLPAFLLYRTSEPRYAMALFNMASYYPLAMLAIVIVQIVS
ncbi:MAG: UbiA family prenyltransferase [Desulfobacterales bacterium]|uniref:UbiA family prenyltransferase n=1 Tax=Candidatus Desulfatibia profunda TaxID=2841695 RepID=A0A8J6NRE0_9BACT|nr:UbiA family prenyltransferase [Candidatus Desulfatibia profunda]MBL7179672.1 UbiA family prenyltransferase [Desulfobacterales bacterium]